WMPAWLTGPNSRAAITFTRLTITAAYSGFCGSPYSESDRPRKPSAAHLSSRALCSAGVRPCQATTFCDVSGLLLMECLPLADRVHPISRRPVQYRGWHRSAGWVHQVFVGMPELLTA